MRETHRTRKDLTLSLSLSLYSPSFSPLLSLSRALNLSLKNYFLCSMFKSSFVAVVVVVIVVVAPGRKAIFVDYQTIHHCVCE